MYKRMNSSIEQQPISESIETLETSNVFTLTFEASQQLCFNSHPDCKFFIAHEKPIFKKTGAYDKSVQEFGAIPNVNDFYTTLMTLPEDKRLFHEIMRTTYPRKLVFDLDLKYEIGEQLKQQYVEIIIDTVITSLPQYSINWHNFVIIDSSAQNVTSIHIVLNGFHFLNLKQSVVFIESIKKNQSFINTFNDIIDWGIYSANKKLRMPLCTKYNENRPLSIVSEHSFFDALVTYVLPSSILLEFDETLIEEKKNPAILNSNESEVINTLVLQNIHLFKEYSQHYGTWIKYGINFFRGGCTCETFLEFSKLCPAKYDEKVCISKWNSFSRYGPDASKLLSFLRYKGIEVLLVDDKTSQLLVFDINDYIYICDIVDEIKRFFGDVCFYDSTTTMCYVFNSTWSEECKNYAAISEHIIKPFFKMLDSDIEKITTLLGDNEFISKNSELCTKLVDKLKVYYKMKAATNSGFSSALKATFLGSFNRPHISELFNADPYLIGFDDGYYDLKNSEFYKHNKDAYITLSCKYSYKEVIEHKYLEEVEELLQKLFPDPEILHYQKKYLASCLYGGNKEQKLHFWTGVDEDIQTGANGKSTLCKLLKYVFGDYFKVGHPNIITGKSEKAESANSAIVNLKNARVVIFQEVQDGTANMARMKSLTGDEEITARGLYKNQENIKITFHPIICANKLPDIEDQDGGTTRRIAKIPYKAKFVDNVDDYNNIPYIFKRDNAVFEKVKEYGPSLMFLLIKYYKIYLEEGIGDDVMPDEIKIFTKQLLEQQDDDLDTFLDETLRPLSEHEIEQLDRPSFDNRVPFVTFKNIKMLVDRNEIFRKKYPQQKLYKMLRNKYKDAYYEQKKYNKKPEKNIIWGYEMF
ncbi:MAG: Heterosigma akashiwo virus 01 [Bacteroidota bacterium]